ncbi:hypothetical protein S40288_01890 [Stachybotrys chartarum IBT 40288]|nr:hypothetical protein S40288_01890 [Stachybotrys chartarum IBT 40288]
MESSKDFKSLQEDIQKSLVSTVKTVNRIAAEDLSFQRTVNPDVAEQLDDKAARFLDLSTRLLQSAAKACGIKGPKLEDAEDVDMRWRAIVDVVDSALEKADTALDEYTGLVKRKESPSADAVHKAKKPKSASKVIRNANIAKPQIHFELQPDNFPASPWKPIITEKPHALVPLEDSVVLFTDSEGVTGYKHPYETEISRLEYPERLFQEAEPIPYQPAETTKAIWVDTFEGVLEMLQDLKSAKEIAVDLEHHDFRTYNGLVCLMQISTREQDWIVDTLRPWRHKLQVLNEVFADPSIIKVFHGAYMDMIWLQRDLGLYVNGLFDTFFASEQLYSGRSLAFLLSKFVDFDADKQYQLADWRLRPIPDEMMYYARSDTHYLLYIFDRVRNDLLAASDRNNPERDFIGRTLERSRELSLSRHEHPGFDEETGEGSRGWYAYILKNAHFAFNAEQFAIFRSLWSIRDEIARKEDESPNFVLGTQNVVEIARVNPPDAKAFHSLLPLTAPLVRSRLSQVWDRIQGAKAKGGPTLLQWLSSEAPSASSKHKNPFAVKTLPVANAVDGELNMRILDQSKLFGRMAISSLWEPARPSAKKPDDLFPFPWQRFVQEATFNDGVVAEVAEPTSEKSERTEKPAEIVEPVENVDAEFTLKRGRKRKSETTMEEESSSSDEEVSDEEMDDGTADGVIRIDDDATQASSAKRKSRKHRRKDRQELISGNQDAKKKIKAERKARKHAKRMEQQESKTKKFEAVPFDYSQASSVMNASKESGGTKKTSSKKVFDPYSKIGDDEIKAARRAPPIKGERSATFKK